MELFSLLLLAALLSLGFSLVVAAWPGKSAALATGGALVAALAAAVSLVVHVLSGHRPGSQEALSALAFVGAHPTLIGVLIVAVALLGWQARRGRDR